MSRIELIEKTLPGALVGGIEEDGGSKQKRSSQHVRSTTVMMKP